MHSGTMRRRGRGSRTVVALLMLVIGAAAFAQSDWIYAAAGDRFAVVDPRDGSVVETGRLATADYDPAAGRDRANIATPLIVPTPGGKYVFFVFADDARAVVVDAESHAPVWSVELPAGTQTISFSSMGETILANTGGTRWIELPHRQGRITGAGRTAPSLGAGAIAFNRRATRVYGSRGADLVFALTASGDAVQTVRVDGGPYDWHISPNFRFLVGVSERRLALVDETRGQATGYLDGSFSGGVFHPSSRQFFALTADGGSIVVAETGRLREQSRIDLPFRLTAIFREESGRLHGLSHSSPFGAGSPVILTDITGDQGIVEFPAGFAEPGVDVAATIVTLRPGGGFACF
ncbi:MAG: hypothetical protein EA382_13200 [Spirochaetaceae bacterium]|nr:MAG: hypothetical protein EA382_13200 [Spirochaetaceae bacterium]